MNEPTIILSAKKIKREGDGKDMWQFTTDAGDFLAVDLAKIAKVKSYTIINRYLSYREEDGSADERVLHRGKLPVGNASKRSVKEWFDNETGEYLREGRRDISDFQVDQIDFVALSWGMTPKEFYGA